MRSSGILFVFAMTMNLRIPFHSVLLTVLFLVSSVITSHAMAAEASLFCSEVFTNQVGPVRPGLFSRLPTTLVPKAIPRAIPHTTGVLLGSANGVLLTATHGHHVLLAVGIAKWLPFFNEIANASSTATGFRWIYSGQQKKMIDGVALGALAGQALHVGAAQGSLAGALTLGASVGLSYWFPNKYFEPIMTGVPNLLPEKAKTWAQTPVGMGVIGISMIAILEQVLEHAQEIAQAIPKYFSATLSAHQATRLPSNDVSPNVSLEHAVALWILDASLPSSLGREVRLYELLYLSGADLAGNFFTSGGIFKNPRVPLSDDVREILRQKFSSPVMAQILTRSEREAVLNRL